MRVVFDFVFINFHLIIVLDSVITFFFLIIAIL